MDIKSSIIEAMKAKDQVKVDILRLVSSEVERTGQAIGKIAEKIISSNNETLSYRASEKLVRENEILSELVPKKIEKREVFDLLFPHKSDIMSGPEGKAIGFAMKIFKSKDINVSDADVREVVKELRS